MSNFFKKNLTTRRVKPVLSEIVSGMVAQWDASNPLSYGGAGTSLRNLIRNPADGSGQSAYDLTLFEGSPGVVFNGPPGSPGAYFDGFAKANNPRFSMAANTNFTNSLHKRDSDDESGQIAFTMGFLFFTAVDDTEDSTLMGTQRADTGGAGVGGRMYHTAGEVVSFRARADGTNASSSLDTQGHGNQKNRVVMLSRGITGSGAPGANITRFHHSGNLTGRDIAHTLPGISVPTDPPDPFTICAETDGGISLIAENKFFGAFLRNTWTSDAEAAAIVAYYNTLHGRNYTV